MRKSIVIALAISSFAISACGNNHKGSAKAKVAEAKITNNKDKQSENVDKIMSQISKHNEELKSLGFGGLDDIGTASGFLNNITGYDANQQSKVKSIMDQVKGEAEALIEAGRDLEGAKNEEQIAKGKKAQADGEKFKQRAMAGIEKMNKQEKK